MELTPENLDVTRDDIQGFLDDGMKEPEIRWNLENRGVSEREIDKIISSLSSYN